MKLLNQRVLIVEDEIFIAMELEHIVRKAGAVIVGPATGEREAMTLLDTEEVSAAILDSGLGRSDSSSIAKRLRAAGIPFVYYTGVPEAELTRGGWPKAPTVRKPADPARLIDALASAAIR